MNDPETVSIIGGTGALGFGLAMRLGHGGIPIVIGSRDGERARQAADDAAARVPGATFTGLENGAAAERARVVILSVPFRSQMDTLAALNDHLRPGQLLVDCTVPLAAAVRGKSTRVLGVWQGSAAQQAAEVVPADVAVCSALHTVSAELLGDLDHQLEEDILVCGDSKADKRSVAAAIGRVDGVRVVDAGRLEQSRIVETLTALLIGMNARYKTRTGLRITGLPHELWA